MKHKTSELEGALLDAAAAKAEGLRVRYDADHDLCVIYEGGDDTGLKERRGPLYNPSREWRDGGPIIERERITLVSPDRRGPPHTEWIAETMDVLMPPPFASSEQGPAPLIAAMRAYVASKLGDEVEL